MTKTHNKLSTESSEQQLTSEAQGFDYTALTPEVRNSVKNKTLELKRLIRRSAQDIIDIGQMLKEVKEQLGHGNFRVWLLAEFHWSIRTAARFMRVAEQFKSANLAHLNIAVSALYLLAKPSTSEQACQKALDLAQQGENITHAKVKAIINSSHELNQSNFLKPVITYIPDQTIEVNSSTLSDQDQSSQTYSQIEPKDKSDSAAIEQSGKAIASTISKLKLEQKAVEKINKIPQEDSETADELKSEGKDYIRVINIEHQNLELVINVPQTFEMTFAGVRVRFEGYPSALIVLFKQMQDNTIFTSSYLVPHCSTE